MRQFWVLAVVALATARGARSQSSAELEAARETEVPGLRLLELTRTDARITALEVRIGYVETDAQVGFGAYVCGGLSGDRAAKASQVVAAGLGRLPDSSVRRVRMRYVILCGGVAKGQGGGTGGIPVFRRALVMLDVGDYGPALEWNTLHELYHLAEITFNSLFDTEWSEIFGGYTKGYAPGLRNVEFGSGKRGFLNAYGETFPYEDRAELFAALLLRPREVVARIRSTPDEVLRRKVVHVADRAERLFGIRIFPGDL